MKTKLPGSRNTLFYLCCMYAGAVLFRFVLALVTTSFPTVGIDEFLYYSLARSIATKGELLFRGQSADYAYILYPLVLSPVYLLFQNGAHFYRLLQLWNILLMSTSVFPLFFLSRKLLCSDKKAFAATAISMLLPDFILGNIIFSEAILYPLFFTLMYCAYEYICSDKWKYALWSGLLGGLMYSTKPGSVVPAALLILFMLGRAIAKKKGKYIILAAGTLSVLVATSAVFMLMARFVFGYKGGILSVYEQQVVDSEQWQFSTFFNAILLYPYYFILSCGIVGIICPVFFWKKWKTDARIFWWFVISALAVMIIGSAWAVERLTVLNNIHLRYVAMYIPLMLLFCYIGEQKTDEKKNTEKKKHTVPSFPLLSTLVPLGFVVLCTVIFGCKAKARASNIHAQISLSLLNDKVLPLSMETIGNAAILVLCVAVFVLFMKKHKTGCLNKICVFFMAGFMVANGIAGYSIMHENYFPKLEEDGLALNQLTDGKPYIYLLSSEGIVDMGVDANTKQNNCIVYTNDFINNLQENNGVYVPYVPEKMRGMYSVDKTPEIDTLVIDYDSFPLFKLSEDVSVASPNDHPTVFVVRFTPGQRIVDSTLSNLSNRTLEPGTPGILLCFNEKYLNCPLIIRMKIKSDSKQAMTINSTHEIYSVDLIPGEKWYEFTFKNAEDAYNFKTQNASIYVADYELIPETK